MALVGLIGGLVTAGGMVVQGIQQAKAQAYMGQVAANQAESYKRLGQQAAQVGMQQAIDQSQKVAQEVGEARTREAAGGTTVGGPSNRAVITTIRGVGRQNVATTDYNALLKKYGYDVEATQAAAQSELYKWQGPQMELGADIGAAGKALSASASFFDPTQKV